MKTKDYPQNVMQVTADLQSHWGDTSSNSFMQELN